MGPIPTVGSGFDKLTIRVKFSNFDWDEEFILSEVEGIPTVGSEIWALNDAQIFYIILKWQKENTE